MIYISVSVTNNGSAPLNAPKASRAPPPPKLHELGLLSRTRIDEESRMFGEQEMATSVSQGWKSPHVHHMCFSQWSGSESL